MAITKVFSRIHKLYSISGVTRRHCSTSNYYLLFWKRLSRGIFRKRITVRPKLAGELRAYHQTPPKLFVLRQKHDSLSLIIILLIGSNAIFASSIQLTAVLFGEPNVRPCRREHWVMKKLWPHRV